jgi:hypothetical protein
MKKPEAVRNTMDNSKRRQKNQHAVGESLICRPT